MTLSQDPQSPPRLASEAFWMFAKKYHLKPHEVLKLMGLTVEQEDEVKAYASSRSIPATDEMYRKVGLLLGIHRLLEKLYSFSPTFRYDFMHMQWSKLNWKSPMEFLLSNDSLIQNLEHIEELLRQGDHPTEKNR